jgi:glycosyltransferase involved in cell wall biosynthesis
MRILIASTAHFPALNGQAIFTQNLVEGLAQQGHQVMAIFPSAKGAAYQKTQKNLQIATLKSYNLNFLHKDVYFSLFSRAAIQKIFDTFHPEIVHIQDHYPVSRDAVSVARRNGVKLVGTNHFMPENLAPYIPLLPRVKLVYNWILWHWMLEVYNRLDVTTAQSQKSAELLCSAGLRVPIFRASCGLDLSRFYPDQQTDRNAFRLRYRLDPSKKVFLFVGRLDSEKRIDVLIRAIQQLERDDVQLAIAGKGAAFSALNALADELNLGERVRFIGYVPNEDLPPLLNSVDVFSMPSDAELLSIASLEAMACGRPVLLANAAALPELVDNGVNGYLFEPGSVEDAARCMALMADHPECWSEMGSASLEKAHHHSMENTIRQYESIYTALLQDHPLPVAEV